MTEMDNTIREFGEKMTQQFEGLRLLPYQDSIGKITIGYGRNLTDNGISKYEAIWFFNNDYDIAEKELIKYVKCWDLLSDTRKIVLIDMCYNIGLPNFMLFSKMLNSIYQNDFITASNEIRNSQLRPDRAEKLAYYMEKGSL